jgi:hypothetical protein
VAKKKQPKMKIFTMIVTQQLKFEAENLDQAEVEAKRSGTIIGEKAGAYRITDVKLVQDEEFSILPDGLTKSKMTKVQKFIFETEHLLKLADARLISSTAIGGIAGSYKWVVDTEVGPYVISLHHKPDEKIVRPMVYSIMGRFLDETVIGRFGTTQHCLKCNFHQYKEWMTLEAFRAALTMAKGKDICEPYTEENYGCH